MRRYSSRSMLTGLLIAVGVVGLAAAQQAKYGGTLRVTWESDRDHVVGQSVRMST